MNSYKRWSASTDLKKGKDEIEELLEKGFLNEEIMSSEREIALRIYGMAGETDPQELFENNIKTINEFFVFMKYLFEVAKYEKDFFFSKQGYFLSLFEYIFGLIPKKSDVVKSGLDDKWCGKLKLKFNASPSLLRELFDFFIQHFDTLNWDSFPFTILGMSLNLYSGLGELDSTFVLFVAECFGGGDTIIDGGLLGDVFRHCHTKLCGLSELDFSEIGSDVMDMVERRVWRKFPVGISGEKNVFGEGLMLFSLENSYDILCKLLQLLDNCLNLIGIVEEFEKDKELEEKVFRGVEIEFLEAVLGIKRVSINIPLYLHLLILHYSITGEYGHLSSFLVSGESNIKKILDFRELDEEDADIFKMYIKGITVVLDRPDFERWDQVIYLVDAILRGKFEGLPFSEKKYIYGFLTFLLGNRGRRFIIIESIFERGNYIDFMDLLVSLEKVDLAQLYNLKVIFLYDIFTFSLENGTFNVVGEKMMELIEVLKKEEIEGGG